MQAGLLETKASVDQLSERIDTYWVQYNAYCIFFMTLGYTLLEMGYTRYKNHSFTLLKNLIIICAAALSWYLWGFGFAWGKTLNNAIGTTFFAESYMNTADDYNNFIISFALSCSSMFVAASVVAERSTPFIYFIWASLHVGVIFPIGYHFAWSTTGWLKVLGFFDFSGAAVVHMSGAAAGLAALLVLKSRKNRFDEKFLEQRPKEFSPSSYPHILFGVLILWFLWFAYSPGNLEKAVSTDFDYSTKIGSSALNNILASSSSALSMLIFTKLYCGSYDVLKVTNALLAGLISVTGGGNAYIGWPALVIGIGAAGVYLAYSVIINKVLKLDDPRDAFALHFGAGSWGLIAVGFFHRQNGLFYGSASLLGANFLGLVIYSVVPFVITLVILILLQQKDLLFYKEDYETEGLDSKFFGRLGFYTEPQSTKSYYQVISGKVFEVQEKPKAEYTKVDQVTVQVNEKGTEQEKPEQVKNIEPNKENNEVNLNTEKNRIIE